MKSKPGSSKRQEHNFVVIQQSPSFENQLPQVSRQSAAALRNVFGHNNMKYTGTSHHGTKPDNDHVHFLL